MNINSYGFKIDHKSLPKAVGPTKFLEKMSTRNGIPVDKKGVLTASAAEIKWNNTDWWGGILVRYRDAKSFNEVQTAAGGKKKLKAHQIGAGQMAELAYYIASTKTGHGLMASYHAGPQMSTLRACAKKYFREACRAQLDEGVEAAGDDADAVDALYKDHAGELIMDHLIPMGSLKKALKSLARVTKFKVQFAGIEDRRGLFQKMRKEAVHESEILTYPPDFVLNDTLINDIAHECDEALSKGLIVEASFTGKTPRGKDQTVSTILDKNRIVFGTKDYDELMGKLEVDLSDWPGSIASSPVIEWLLQQTTPPEMKLALS